MTNKGYMAFMPDWREIKKDLTPEQWYELEDYMFQLRFDGIDTDPSSIQDKEIKLAWRLIRPAIKKIIRNYKYKQKQLSNKNAEITPNLEFEDEIDATPQPMEESVSEGQEMGKIKVPEIYQEDSDFRYGEIDTSDPMMSFLREDEEPNEGKAIEPPSYYVKRNKSGETWEEYIKRISNKDVAV